MLSRERWGPLPETDTAQGSEPRPTHGSGPYGPISATLTTPSLPGHGALRKVPASLISILKRPLPIWTRMGSSLLCHGHP